MFVEQFASTTKLHPRHSPMTVVFCSIFFYLFTKALLYALLGI